MEPVISGPLKPKPLTIVVSEDPVVIALKDVIQGIQGEGGDVVPRMKDHYNPLVVKELAGPFDHRHVVVRIGNDPDLHHLLLTGSLLARVPEPPLPPPTFGEFFNLLQFGAADLIDDQLGDPVSIPDDEGLIPQVDHDATDLTTVVGIDGPRSIEQGYPILQGEPAAGSHLGLISLREGNGNARGDKTPFPGGQRDLLLQRGEEVHPRGMGCHIPRECSP
jgi:hypothetical protein